MYIGKDTRLRRHTLRIDGFVSVEAPLRGGELLTKPVRFEGSTLVINFSTSAAGSVRVEIQDRDGQPIDGHALADCRRQLVGGSHDHLDPVAPIEQVAHQQPSRCAGCS